MKLATCLKDFVVVFALAFAVTAAVSFLWSLLAHGAGVVDWGSAVRFGIIFGILLPWMGNRQAGRVKGGE